ncbi:hypothetical protein [Algimonas arctica]|nr:hypothetical protein [Algimonas arctica]
MSIRMTDFAQKRVASKAQLYDSRVAALFYPSSAQPLFTLGGR